ncbi:MAG: aminoglycoside phosphotransferase family protein [Clostridia bacterium]|nr:aminoglycoside phosphotransferase family protein [Clostridia bacterium]
MTQVKEIFPFFDTRCEYTGDEEIISGHINRTYRVDTKQGRRFILQKMNTYVFPRADYVMENILLVTGHIRDKARERGADPERATLHPVRTLAGGYLYEDGQGGKWRMYRFTEGAVSLQSCDSPEVFRSVGEAFGTFQRDLADFDAKALHETIERFHDTPNRFAALKKAYETDACQRAAQVEKEYRFVLDRVPHLADITRAMEEGTIPLRVTHNDTKLNNVMVDEKTGRAVCVIDLDTVMPGSALYDFGDAIRFGASSAAEDETDLEKVFIRTEYFESFLEGFLTGLDGALTPCEIEMLPRGAWMMTIEVGIRFLADYLDGDRYFRVEYPQHNLDRARNQFKLVADLEEKWDALTDIARRYS